MDFLNLVQQIKNSSDGEVQSYARQYNLNFSEEEVRQLRPLLDDISFHWVFTGIPRSFIEQVEQIIGVSKTNTFLKMYEDAISDNK